MKAPDDAADERLRIEAAQRDPGRFGELYEAHFERVYAYVVRRVHDRHEAEDVTSDVFHQALAHLDRFEWRGVPFAAWLFRIAANAVADRWKRVAREQARPAAESALDPASERIEERASLFRLVARLPADQKRVVAMRFTEQKTTREIARELGRSEGAVKQLQFRALQSLRAGMGRANG